MAELSVTSAATEGFQVIRYKPVAVVAWLAAYAAAVAVIIGLVAATVGFTAFANLPSLMEAAQNDTPLDPAVVMSLLTALLTTVLIVALVGIVVESVIITAVKRAVLRPEDGGFAYMRLGGDEVRTFLVLFVKGLLFFGVLLLFGILAFLLARLIHPALIALVVLACIPVFIYLAVKLSLSVSQSFAERRFNLFGSWGLTRGHFWELMGVYVLAAIFYFIAYAVLSTIGGLAGGNALMAEMMKDPENVDWRAMGSLMGAGMMINMVVSIILKGVEFPVLGAPPAAAYRDLTLEPAE